MNPLCSLEKIALIAVAVGIVAGLVLYNTAEASERHHPDFPAVNGTNGSPGVNGVNGINGSNYNDDSVTRMIASSSAIAMIPAINHVGDGHQHTNAGVGLASNGDNAGVALGINHQIDNMSLKGAVGLSGSERTYGVGFGLNW